MPFWYNTPSEGSEYSNLACTDFAGLNSLIKFDEVAFKSDDDFNMYLAMLLMHLI
ncbi:hypothetical protein [Dulcicalothrix desertica]|uniref:hypothetical protein n=1 Tax=Dulcicalothrix desertica TaxID=32056 RepID=UPI001199A651|nr:hypothetical protein [Dulcicalothrix desertica]TWH55512.1 hypothetical protein CAL7102_03656 [Dulcicalothrix desertica PCC 7102]